MPEEINSWKLCLVGSLLESLSIRRQKLASLLQTTKTVLFYNLWWGCFLPLTYIHRQLKQNHRKWTQLSWTIQRSQLKDGWYTELVKNFESIWIFDASSSFHVNVFISESFLGVLSNKTSFKPVLKREKMGVTSKSLHVRYSHPQNGKLVRFPGEGTAGGHHIWQLGNVGCHLVPSPPLDFAMILPTVSCKKSHRSLHLLSKLTRINTT